MSTGCVTNASITSGGQITGLVAVAGSPGSNYYVTVSANASAGYLASAASAVSLVHAATSVLNAPTGLTIAHFSNFQIQATFTAPTGTVPTSYNAKACTDLAMTLNCVSVTGFSSGSLISPVLSTNNYYVQITALATGYLSSVVESAGTVQG
jgi:hypothetical protein